MSETRAVYNTNGHPNIPRVTLLEAAKNQHEIIYALLRLAEALGVKVCDELPTLLAEIIQAKLAIDAAQKEESI